MWRRIDSLVSSYSRTRNHIKAGHFEFVNQPCKTAVTCPCDSLPATGYSSEALDVSEFMATAFAQVVPVLGNSTWQRLTCQATELDPASFANALLAAELEATLCANGQASPYAPDTFPPGGNGGGGGGGGGGTGATFFNSPQTAEFICPDGSPFVFTVGAGLFTGTSQLAADTAAQSYAQSQVAMRAVCLSALSNTSANVNQAFTATITGTGGELAVPPQTNTWTLSGTLPTGLAFQPNTPSSNQATITGTPTVQNQTSTFAVTLTDPVGNTMTKTYSLLVACPNSFQVIANVDSSGTFINPFQPYSPGGIYDTGYLASARFFGDYVELEVIFSSGPAKTWNLSAGGTGGFENGTAFTAFVIVNGTNNPPSQGFAQPTGTWNYNFQITTSGCANTTVLVQMYTGNVPNSTCFLKWQTPS